MGTEWQTKAYALMLANAAASRNNERMTDYQPQEGVDYLVDLYQVAAIEQDAEAADIKQALNARLREYHPDRLEGLAPEFRRAGERMARLLNRARVVLLDTDKRAEYDGILNEWDGPVSKDGTPVITMDGLKRAEAATKTPEEIEAGFAADEAKVTGMVNYKPSNQALLARLYETADDETEKTEFGQALDDALFAEDQVLAISEAERSELLGLTTNARYETTLGYANDVKVAIAAAGQQEAIRLHKQAIGNVGIRLALMAGENSVEAAGEQSAELVDLRTVRLPEYFSPQAKKIEEIAQRREEILEKRLELFTPTYPIAELQTEGQPNFVIGITGESRTTWVGFHFDADEVAITNIDVANIQTLLDAEQYEQLYAIGYNVLTFAPKEQIELKTLLEEAYNKHLAKYYPELFGEDDEDAI